MMHRLTKIPQYVRMLIGVGLLLVIEFVIVFILVTPAIHDIQSLQTKIDDEKQGLELRYQRGTHLNALKETYQRLDPSIEAWKAHFIKIKDEKKMLDLITELETLAGRARVTKTLRLTEAGSMNNVPKGTIPSSLDFSMEGQFPNVIQYLRSIERLPIFYSVDRVSFTGASISLLPTHTDNQPGNALVHLTGFLWGLE